MLDPNDHLRALVQAAIVATYILGWVAPATQFAFVGLEELKRHEEERWDEFRPIDELLAPSPTAFGRSAAPSPAAVYGRELNSTGPRLLVSF